MDIHAKTALLAIVASHLVADFWLQGDGDVLAKRRFQFFAYLKHGATHALGGYIFAGLWSVWQIPAVVLVSHPAIDGLKEAFLRWLVPRDAEGKPSRNGSSGPSSSIRRSTLPCLPPRSPFSATTVG